MTKKENKPFRFLAPLDRLVMRIPALRHVLRPDSDTMVLRQTHFWSRAILWTIIGTFVAAVLWACFAKTDEVIHATGKLEPRGSVRDVQSPVGGVVEESVVREGDRVKAGQILVRLDSKVSAAEVKSLEERLASMNAERAFYDSLFNEAQPADAAPKTVSREIADLAKNRAALMAEVKLLRRLRDETSQLHKAIQTSEASNAALGVEDPVSIQLAEMKALVEGDYAREQGLDADSDSLKFFANELTSLSEQYLRSRDQLEELRKIEANKRQAFEAFTKLNKDGNLSRVDFLARQSEWMNSIAQVKNLEAQTQNIPTVFKTETNNRIQENGKRIAEIDANLTKVRLENVKLISETGSRLAAARETLVYHEIKAPSDGIVFETVATKPGTVVAAKDPVLRIVPSGELIAKVDITNRDIGFISLGMPCEVEVDTFPKREFGFIEGEVYFVGSDVLPPNEVRKFYSFPAKISLAKQSLQVRDKNITLQSGMSVGVNIKVRKRHVINIFLDSLLGPIDKMKEVR
ncbi:MAG: HlyD family efflux transporter periplasmic adaptor subunit [Spartobacteria bacterium]